MFHIRRVRCFANGRTEPLTGRPEPCRDTCAAGASAGPPADTSARTPPNPPAPAGRCCAAAPRRCTRRWGTRRWGSPSARDEAEPALRERGGGANHLGRECSSRVESQDLGSFREHAHPRIPAAECACDGSVPLPHRRQLLLRWNGNTISMEEHPDRQYWRHLLSAFCPGFGTRTELY